MNYTGDHPLNLIGKLAIVTPCATPTGAAIARALLNSNALVLGVDRDVPHDSTQSSKGSHFQFLKCGREEDEIFGAKVVEAAGGRFGRDDGDVDFLVVVEKGAVGFSGVVDGMLERGCRVGMVLCVCVGVDREEEIKRSAKAAGTQEKYRGIRFNVLVDHNVQHSSNISPIFGEATRIALQGHIHEHDLKRKKGGYAVEKERELANLALFLCTVQGEGVRGALIGIDGSLCPL